MMNKKRYFVLSPACLPSRTEELKQKASSYYGVKEYEEVSSNTDLRSLLMEVLKELSNADCNGDLLLTGMSIIAISKSDSVYVAKDWEQDDMCKVCHMLAFSHGLDIVYEPV